MPFSRQIDLKDSINEILLHNRPNNITIKVINKLLIITIGYLYDLFIGELFLMQSLNPLPLV
jgi:hypothetical protein